VSSKSNNDELTLAKARGSSATKPYTTVLEVVANTPARRQKAAKTAKRKIQKTAKSCEQALLERIKSLHRKQRRGRSPLN